MLPWEQCHLLPPLPPPATFCNLFNLSTSATSCHLLPPPATLCVGVGPAGLTDSSAADPLLTAVTISRFVSAAPHIWMSELQPCTQGSLLPWCHSPKRRHLGKPWGGFLAQESRLCHAGTSGIAMGGCRIPGVHFSAGGTPPASGASRPLTGLSPSSQPQAGVTCQAP